MCIYLYAVGREARCGQKLSPRPARRRWRGVQRDESLWCCPQRTPPRRGAGVPVLRAGVAPAGGGGGRPEGRALRCRPQRTSPFGTFPSRLQQNANQPAGMLVNNLFQRFPYLAAGIVRHTAQLVRKLFLHQLRKGFPENVRFPNPLWIILKFTQ